MEGLYWDFYGVCVYLLAQIVDCRYGYERGHSG